MIRPHKPPSPRCQTDPNAIVSNKQISVQMTKLAEKAYAHNARTRTIRPKQN